MLISCGTMILSVFSEERRECVSVLMVSFVVDEVKAQAEILTSYRAYFFCKLGIFFKKSFKLDKRGFCDECSVVTFHFGASPMTEQR